MGILEIVTVLIGLAVFGILFYILFHALLFLSIALIFKVTGEKRIVQRTIEVLQSPPMF